MILIPLLIPNFSRSDLEEYPAIRNPFTEAEFVHSLFLISHGGYLDKSIGQIRKDGKTQNNTTSLTSNPIHLF
jgi:hypothetical protein